MSKLIRILGYPLRFVLYVLIYLYRYILKPFFPGKCCYTPTCSEYMLQSIREWGAIKGVALGLKRILKCNPKHTGGIDRVPLNLEGEHRWVF